MALVHCNSLLRMRVDRAAREGAPLVLTGAHRTHGSGNIWRAPPCHRAWLGPEGPCPAACLGGEERPPYPRSQGSAHPGHRCCTCRFHCQRANRHSLFLHFCPFLAGGEAQAQRSRRRGRVHGHTGLKALRWARRTQAAPLSLWGVTAFPAQQWPDAESCGWGVLQSWPLSKTSPAPLNSERNPPGSDCGEHSCRPVFSP